MQRQPPRVHSARVRCPYCGAPLSVTVDGSVEFQEYIEDCQVCCRPIVFTVAADDDGDIARVETRRDDD